MTATTATQPDTEAGHVSALLKTAATYAVLRASHEEADSRLQTALAAADALHPEPPAPIQNPQRRGSALTRDELAKRDACAAEVTRPRPAGSPRVEAFDRWLAQVAAIDSSFGIPGLADAAERAANAEDEAAARVASMRAGSIHEAAAKYAVLLGHWGNTGRDHISSAQVFFDFLSDLEGLATASAQQL